MNNRNRRKHYLTNKPFQFRYVFYIVATLVIVSAAGIMSTYYGIWASVIDAFSAPSIRDTMLTGAQTYKTEPARQLETDDLLLSPLQLFQETEHLSSRQKEIIRNILDETHHRLIRLGELLIAFIGWGSLFLTHKIAGPLFRLKHSCQELGSGNLTMRIEFRKLDEARDVARDFNKMAASLDGTISTMKRIAHTLPPSTASKELDKALARFRTTSD